MNQLLYIIGASNTGKTTCLNKALAIPLDTGNWPIAHTLYRGGIQLGLVRDQFSGTDALGKHVQISVPNWLHGRFKPRYMVGEGVRFSTQKFMSGLLEHGWRLHILRLTADDAILAERRGARTAEQLEWLKKHKKAEVHRDHEQTDEWLASNVSAVNKLYDWLETQSAVSLVTMDTTTQEGLDAVVDWLSRHPVIVQLNYGERDESDPGTLVFGIWKNQTMKGREMLKAEGVGRWQYEPAMAFPDNPLYPPDTAEEGSTICWWVAEDGTQWSIYASPKKDTEYARLKRQRNAKLDEGKGPRSELQDPKLPKAMKCKGHSTGLHCACIDTHDKCCDCPAHIDIDGNLCLCEKGIDGHLADLIAEEEALANATTH